ncbi:MAG: right-handed parallel beta-helix repeat-containing protein, partial [bacterium]
VVGNVISDVDSNDYGGWGIYFDEGSTGVVAEGNLVYRTKSGGFHQHYGRDNVVRNNIFALAREAQLIRTRAEPHRSFTLQGNLVLADGAPLLGGDWSGTGFELDRNLFWDLKAAPAAPRVGTNWTIADPLFRDPRAGDFRLRPGSPAARIGFKPFDPLLAGPRGKKPNVPGAPAAYPPGDRLAAELLPIAEDFEDVAPGEKTPDASTYEDHDRGTARVGEGDAGSGRRALRFVKADPVAHEWNPHMHYSRGFTAGALLGSFSAKVEPGAGMAHEWREVLPPGSDPWYRAGPALRVDGAGVLTAGGRALGRVAPGRWTRFELRYALGTATAFDLIVTPAGGPPARHAALPCAALARLDWWGFMPTGKETGVQFHLDDLALRPARAAAPSSAEDAGAVLRDAMQGAHEARPHGVGDGVDWAKRPRVGMGNALPPGWTAMTAWGQVYEALDGNPARNVRVHIRNMRAYLLRKSDSRWVGLQSSTAVEGAAYREDFAGDANIPADIRKEPGGGVAVKLLPAHNFHFWPPGARPTLDPADVGGLVVTFAARLVLDDPRGPDDRAQARIVAGAGGDFWRSPTAAWDRWKTNGDFAIGRFLFVRSEWRLFAAHTLTAGQLAATPPPIP